MKTPFRVTVTTLRSTSVIHLNSSVALSFHTGISIRNLRTVKSQGQFYSGSGKEGCLNDDA